MVINYRSFKKLLGETSLERKCRLLFGAALMILITASFWIYAALTRQLVEGQQVAKARRDLVPVILQRRHMEKFQELTEPDNGDVSSHRDDMSPDSDARRDAKPGNKDAEPQHGDAESAHADETDTATTTLDWKSFRELLNTIEQFRIAADWDVILKDDIPPDELAHEALQAFKAEQTEWHQIIEDPQTGDRALRYFAAVRADRQCLRCHDGTLATAYADNEYVGMVSVTISMADVEAELTRNHAILLFSGIITTFIAMLVAYAIVRYIIVKPVQHLKDVSDEIARGNLNLRAEINTGDEFEELSHAFNRMLRHMTTVNDELRGVNDNLDAKVDQLAQANMELFRSNALKDEFLATMSHELRTPLNSILGFSDVLANASNLDERQKRYVENIRTSGRSLMVQINDLLDLAKIESGQMKLQPGELQLMDLLESQCSQMTPLADQKNIELRIQPPDRPLPPLYQDAGKIRQILNNLLSNAIKFTPEGGRVRVSARQLNDESVAICVEDTGIGIPMQEQSEIFEKFRQGTTVLGQRDHVKREYGGTGLGLSIVRELSRLMGGDVSLESEFGKGSAFTVTLPIVAPPEEDSDTVELEPVTDVAPGITSVDLLNASEEDSTGDNKETSSSPSEDNAANAAANKHSASTVADGDSDSSHAGAANRAADASA